MEARCLVCTEDQLLLSAFSATEASAMQAVYNVWRAKGAERTRAVV